jgi:glutamyl-tRNA reductase
MSKEEVHDVMNRLSFQKDIVIISTCQRIEAYSGYGYVPEHVIRHLFRLTSGLESVFIGDTSIQSQVKKAYVNTQQKHKLDKSLHRLFQKALHTGKRIRTETSISKGAVNHEQATYQYLNYELAKSENPTIVVIGVNALSTGIIHLLKKYKFNNIHLFNRTLAKAANVAERFNIYHHSIENLQTQLPFADFIISCTSSDNSIVKKHMISCTKPVTAVDLAIPGDFDADTHKIKNLKLADIHEIEQFINNNKLARFNEMKKADQIIEQEISDFLKWQITNAKWKKAA